MEGVAEEPISGQKGVIYVLVFEPVPPMSHAVHYAALSRCATTGLHQLVHIYSGLIWPVAVRVWIPVGVCVHDQYTVSDRAC